MERHLIAILQLWVGGFFLYHALNAFYGWRPLPPSSAAFTKFLQILYGLGPLMLGVKWLEILAGGALVVAVGARGVDFLWALDPMTKESILVVETIATVLLLPIVVVIAASHLILNFRRGAGIALWTFLPFAIFLFLRGRELW